MKVNWSLTNSRVMYFFYYMAVGAYLPYINLYFQRIGLTGIQIGLLSAIPLVVTSSTSIIWAGIADRLQIHRRILNLALFLGPIAAFFMMQFQDYAALLPIVVLFAFLITPIIPLMESAALEAAGIHKRTYGGLRVWGTIGWMISTWVVGVLIDKFNIRWLFYSFFVLMAISFIVSLFQPARIQVLRTSFRLSLRQMASQRAFLFFMVSIFLLATGMGAVNYFFSLYLDDLGAAEGLIGLAWSVAAFSEIPVIAFSGAIIKRTGAKGLLGIGFIAYAIRWVAYSFVRLPVWVLPVQLIHGLSFGAFQVGGVTFVNERTPEGLSTTAQAIFSTITYGFGPIAGALVGGYFYDTVGMESLFQILSLLVLTGFVLFWWGTKNRTSVEISHT